MIKNNLFLILTTITLSSEIAQPIDLKNGIVLNYSDINFYTKNQRFQNEKALEQTINNIKNITITITNFSQDIESNKKLLLKTIEQIEAFTKIMRDFLELNAKLKKQIINSTEIQHFNDFIKLATKTKAICNTILTDPLIKKNLKKGLSEKYNALIEKCRKNTHRLKNMHEQNLQTISIKLMPYSLTQNSI